MANNSVLNIYNNLTDDILFKCFKEITYLYEHGILIDGECRKIQEQLKKTINNCNGTLDSNINNILREISFRWYNSKLKLTEEN